MGSHENLITGLVGRMLGKLVLTVHFHLKRKNEVVIKMEALYS